MSILRIISRLLRTKKGVRPLPIPAPAGNSVQSIAEQAQVNINLTLEHVLNEFRDCIDLVHRTIPNLQIDLVYFDHSVDQIKLTRDVIMPLSAVQQPHQLQTVFSQSQFTEAVDSKDFILSVLKGHIGIFHGGKAYLFDAYKPESRSVKESETESVITGPHDSFVENAEKNLSLLRSRLKSSHLKVIKLSVGEVTKSDVFLLYVDGLANMDHVRELTKRIKMIEIDFVTDGHMLLQFIDDQPNAIFPQFISSERVDASISRLSQGRIIGIMDGSPSVFSAPSSFFEFFSSPDDYYQRWTLGTATRLLRFVAFGVTVTFTALYVSVTTYHYEMIPETLLITLTKSRSRVPFPPLYEALLMETTIELLREAGARLPTKIGQTIGIVGGIVIGQAAVQAGLTSNILIIAVASSAIASFVIPSYVMSASIRLIRFGLILLAGILGNMGLMIGVALVVIHLSGLTSLGSSYLNPVAPMRWDDWKDIFIRAPFWMLKDRPSQSASPNPRHNKMRK